MESGLTKERSPKPHRVILDDRNVLTATGVSNVERFDEQTVIADTELGELTIRGDQLKIQNLNVEAGELIVEGKIAGLVYTENQPRNAGFLSRLFR